jgi:hypothetical protein
MAEKTKKRIINLLPNKGDNILNQFLSWALTIGRLLVIITESLALGVFLFRFSIDKQLIDLHDQINQASSIVASYGNAEPTYRNLLARLTDIKTYDKESNQTLTIMNDVVTMGRGLLTFKTIIITSQGIDLEIEAPSASTISVFTNKLKNYPEIAHVSVDRVENKTSSALVTVGITAALKGAKPLKQIENEEEEEVQE